MILLIYTYRFYNKGGMSVCASVCALVCTCSLLAYTHAHLFLEINVKVKNYHK